MNKFSSADYYDDFFGYEDYDYYGGGYAPQMPRGRGGRGAPPVSIKSAFWTVICPYTAMHNEPSIWCLLQTFIGIYF